MAIVLHPGLHPLEITCKEICKGYLLSVHLFKAFVTSRLHFEFQLSDFMLFLHKWCVKESFCKLVDGVLIVNL